MRAAVIFLMLVIMGGCGTQSHTPAAELGGLKFTELAPGVWMHTSYKDLPQWGPFPTNGLIIEREGGSILVDTAWDNDQTKTLLQWAEEELRNPIAHAVFTHAHDDKMGGVGIINENGIEGYASALSNTIAPKKGLTPAEHSLEFKTPGDSVELWGLEVLYPGPGHTVDNITVWLPDEKMLFGGCLIRPPGTRSLGNTADAAMTNWDISVDLLRNRYTDVELVVPSHGPPAGPELLNATINLVRANSAE